MPNNNVCYVKNTPKLKFGNGNSKLSPNIATFSLPAGYTCPFAKECLSKANILTGKIIDGKHCQFRCFAASQECVYPNVRAQRWHNFNILKSYKTVEKMGELIQSSIPKGFEKVRIHVSGDYFSEAYFLAWLNVALNNPGILFYGYTKAIPHLVKYRKHIPTNFRLTASKGGTHDHLIKQYNLKFAEVVYSLDEAKDKGLAVDHDDGLAMYGDKSFALILHGMQGKGTFASKALSKLRKAGIGGYGEKGNRFQVASVPFKVIIDMGKGMKFVPKGITRKVSRKTR